jgi:hypothetical protein
MIVFLQKTWFLWWILANLFILQWFHRLSARSDERNLGAADSGDETAATASSQAASETASRLFS